MNQNNVVGKKKKKDDLNKEGKKKDESKHEGMEEEKDDWQIKWEKKRKRIKLKP